MSGGFSVSNYNITRQVLSLSKCIFNKNYKYVWINEKS